MSSFAAGPAAPSFTGQLITIGSQKARQVAWAGSGPVYLVNRSLLTTVYLGSDEGMDAAGNDTGVLDPLGSMPLDGQADVWALTRAGTAIVNALPGSSAWAPSPAQIAAQIAATGVPLLTLPQSVITASNVALPAGLTTIGGGPLQIGQIGYEGFLSVYTAAVTASPVQVLISWQDASGGRTIAQDQFWIYAGPAIGTEHIVHFKGPSKAGWMLLQMSGSVNACTLDQLEFLSVSRVYPFDLWRTISGSFQAGAGVARANYDTISNSLARESLSTGTGVTQNVCLPLWTGKTQIRGSTASATTDYQLTVTDASDGVAGNIANLLNVKSDALGIIALQELYLGRAQCILHLRNANAGTQNLEAALTAAEY